MRRQQEIRCKFKQRKSHEGPGLDIPVDEGVGVPDFFPGYAGDFVGHPTVEKKIQIHGSGCISATHSVPTQGVLRMVEETKKILGGQGGSDFQNTVQEIRVEVL
jgi:hypothetical protein